MIKILLLAPDIALIYVGLGDQDQAMIWLNKAYEARFKASSCCARPSIHCDFLHPIGLNSTR
jgi:hypothetical protein